LGKRRPKTTRRKSSSSADIRFTFVLVGLGAVVVFIASVLVGQARVADWTGVAISGALIVALVAIGVFSVFQKRRR
jgi:uncharacterized protein (DUF983 family)